MSERLGSKSGFPHFMLKEIYDQPEAVRSLVERWLDPSGSVSPPHPLVSKEDIDRLSKVTVAASGSSRHAGLVAEFMFERMTGLPVEVDFASQYCYRDPVVSPNELAILISQSGTTIDTIAALQEARRRGAKSLAICNVSNSPLVRQADAALLTYAGTEIAVAATKSFTAQVTSLFMLAVFFAQARGVAGRECETASRALQELPGKITKALSVDGQCRELALEFANSKDVILMGRDIDYPVVLEGALKLKEISYVHAEGYPTGEIKHGANALVNDQLPIIVIATRDETDQGSLRRYEKTLSNIREFAARGTRTLALITEGDSEIAGLTPFLISLPNVPSLLQPIIEVIPFQLLAYHIAATNGHNVDQPRNLSKSVLVE